MGRATFIKSLDLAESMGHYISIGGGEPTLHKYFWDFIGLAISRRAEEYGLWLSTNGSLTEDSIRLARLASCGVLSVSLSLDSFHDPIDPKVVEAFKSNRFSDSKLDSRGIRTVSSIINVGRAKNNGIATTDDIQCCCDDLFISPVGKIWSCGCKITSFGTVFNPKIPEEFDFDELHSTNHS